MTETVRGPMCSTRCGPGWIDDGTLCRTRSYPWGPDTSTRRRRPIIHSVHLYSNLPKHHRSKNPEVDVTFNTAGHAANKPGHTYMRATNLGIFELILKILLRERRRLRMMDFHTHGRGGEVILGPDTLNANVVMRWSRRRLHRLFSAGARVEFHGCNVAEGPEGEHFLATFGSVFLRQGGGTVKASTGLGIRSPTESGAVYHPFGKTVTAKVRPGGAVTLVNHRHLHASVIRNEAQRLLRIVGGGGSAGHHLREALRYTGGAAVRPSYRRIYIAHMHLKAASQAIQTPA